MTFFVLFLFAGLQDPEPAGAKVADIKSFTGKVAVVDAKAQAREPKMVGRRLRNASLYDEDRLRTESEATAEVIFPDASTLTVKPRSEIQILERQLKKPTAEGKTVGRRIRLLVGEMVTQVVPSKTVQTDFETPSGTAAVRGTGGILTVNPATGVVTITMTEGSMQFIGSNNQVMVTLSAGQSASFSFDRATGAILVQILADAGGAISGQVGGRQMRLSGNDRVRVQATPAGQVQMQAVQGDVQIQNAAGTFENMQGPNFETPVDPNLGSEFFDPFLMAPPLFDPTLADVPLDVPPDAQIFAYDDPLFTSMLYGEELGFTADAEYPNGSDMLFTDVFYTGFEEFFYFLTYEDPFLTDPTAPVEDPFFLLKEDYLHAMIQASASVMHAERDKGSFMNYGYGMQDYEGIFPRDYIESKFHDSLIPLGQIVEDEIAFAFGEWFNRWDTDAIGSTRLALFRADPDWGHDAWANDLRAWASRIESGINDLDTQHLFGHAIIGALHHNFHVDNDGMDDIFLQYTNAHINLHADADNLHSCLHVSLATNDLHTFVNDFMVTVHNRWHYSMDQGWGGPCADSDYATPGHQCQISHDELHGHLDAFHFHVHAALGIPDSGPHSLPQPLGGF